LKYPYLVILYGKFSNKFNEKQQKMIDGNSVCGYRPYAKEFGEIIYLSKQNISESWEKWITKKDFLIDYLRMKKKKNPDMVIWSIKHDVKKDEVLAEFDNTVYYSCCAYHTNNKAAKISLVDTVERKKSPNQKLWVKGKDPIFWVPDYKFRKEYDFLLIGRRGDKNELFFIDKMKNKKVKILWIGGQKFSSQIKKIIINKPIQVVTTKFLGLDEIVKEINKAKIGIILSEIPAEGFPQTFLEMNMCGLPVIMLEKFKIQKCYKQNCLTIYDKNDIMKKAEEFILIYNKNGKHLMVCTIRAHAKDDYSLKKSYKSILDGLK